MHCIKNILKETHATQHLDRNSTATFWSYCTVLCHWADCVPCVCLALDYLVQLWPWSKNCFSVSLSLLLLPGNICQRATVGEVSEAASNTWHGCDVVKKIPVDQQQFVKQSDQQQPCSTLFNSPFSSVWCLLWTSVSCPSCVHLSKYCCLAVDWFAICVNMQLNSLLNKVLVMLKGISLFCLFKWSASCWHSYTWHTDSRRFLVEESQRPVHIRVPPPHPLLGILEEDLFAVEGAVDAGNVAQLLLLLLQPAAQTGLRLLQLLRRLPALHQILETQTQINTLNDSKINTQWGAGAQTWRLSPYCRPVVSAWGREWWAAVRSG